LEPAEAVVINIHRQDIMELVEKVAEQREVMVQEALMVDVLEQEENKMVQDILVALHQLVEVASVMVEQLEFYHMVLAAEAAGMAAAVHTEII
jgi:hypothetical protein